MLSWIRPNSVRVRPSFPADQTQGSSNTFSSFVNGDVETFEQISVAQDDVRVVFSCQTADTALSTQTAETIPHTTQTDGTLSSTTQTILDDCPR